MNQPLIDCIHFEAVYSKPNHIFIDVVEAVECKTCSVCGLVKKYSCKGVYVREERRVVHVCVGGGHPVRPAQVVGRALV